MREGAAQKEKHEVILTAAQTLFGHYGYRRTSIDDIAQEAGIAKGTVYLYFKSKDDIFRALSQQLSEQVLSAAEAAVHTNGPIEERLRRMLEAKFGFFFELVHRSAHARELIDAKNQLCADLFTQADRRYLRLLTDVIVTATAQGELHPDRVGLEPEAAAKLIIRCAVGNETSSAATPPSLAVFRRHLVELVRVLVVGLGGQITR
jgi:AcrR family transcriptional regulator